MNNLTEKKQKWSDFINKKNDKEFLFMLHCSSHYHGVVRPPLYREYKNERIEWIIKTYNIMTKHHQIIDDDTIPFLDMTTGTEIFAESFGCKVHKPKNDMPFALPLITKADEVSKIKIPKVEDSSMAYLIEMAQELRKKTDKNALFKLIDIQTPMDISALIWDKTEFFPAMYDEPEAIKELSLKIQEFMFNFFDLWFKEFGDDFIAHYPNYYMEKGITISEDEIGAVSSEMFKEFFEEELHEFSCRYGGMGMHTCANSFHQWQNLKNIPNLKVLNIVQPLNIINKGYRFFGNDLIHYHGWHGTEWYNETAKPYKSIFDFYMETTEQAVEFSKGLKDKYNI